MTAKTKTTAPPPAWPDAPGWGSGNAIAPQARRAYAHLVTLGVTLPTEVVEAVERVNRARSLTLDTEPASAARDTFQRDLAAYVHGHRSTAPSLDSLALAITEQSAAQMAHDVIQRAGDAADNDAATALRAAAPSIIEDLRPRWDQIMAEAVTLAESFAPSIVAVTGLGADRDALLRWADLADLAAEWSQLTDARERLWLVTHVQAWQQISDARHVAAHLDRAPVPEGYDTTQSLLWLARQRERVQPWWPTDDQMAGKEAPTVGRPQAMEVTRKGLREPKHSDGVVL